MEPLKWCERMIDWFFNLFDRRTDQEKLNESFEYKKQMCIKAQESNICSKDCQSCVWRG